MPMAVRIVVAAALATAVVVATSVFAVPSRAQSTGGPAQLYPQSRLKISVSRKARANSQVRVTFTGTNALFTTGAPITYTLEAFVQARRDLPTCPRSYDEALNNLINLGPSGSIMRIASNLNEGTQGRFRIPVRYRAGPTRRVVFCAYSRLITDDAAYAQLRMTLRRPRRR